MRDSLWVNDNGTTSIVQVDDQGNRIIDNPAVTPLPKPEITPEPFAGKGDHDNNGKVGGAAPAASFQHRPGKRR